jgi:glycosyltransferase involved in cell wall biosynthesis
MVLVSHPTGNANVRAVIRALDRARLLDSFCTTIGMAEEESARWRKLFFRQRSYPLPRGRLKLCPFREAVRMLSSRLGYESITRHETGWASIDSVYHDMDQQVSRRLRKGETRKRLRGVYCYEDGALETFRTARELGLRRFYDLPIAHYATSQRLLREEAARMPDWEPTLGGTRDSIAKLSRKAQEIELAEIVICPSQFVASSLPETSISHHKVVIAAFGSPMALPQNRARERRSKKLRILFAGSMSQRKGLGDLLLAMRLLKRNDIELVVMGAPQAPMEFYRARFAEFVYEPVRPHSQVLELMRTCDVLCLPSIVEGRALVMQEAMSQGLPLIITPNTGGEDLIAERVTGFLVPIRNPSAIAEKIAWFADNRCLLGEMSRAAQSKAGQYSWDAYGQTIVATVKAREESAQ